MLLWCDMKVIIEEVAPDCLHVLPVSDATVFYGARDAQEFTSFLCFESWTI